MKRSRSITLVSFAATVLASCDAPPTIESCMAAATRGAVPAACERVLADNEAAFVTGGGLQPDADQCYAFAQNDSYPQSCDRFVSRSTGTITSSGGQSRPWIFVNSGTPGPRWWSRAPSGVSTDALRSRGILSPPPSAASRLSSTTAIPKVAAPAPAARTFSIFTPSRGGFGSIGGRGVSVSG